MSFRGRLFIFFTIIVIVPMAAVGVVLFKVTSDSETGKSDSRIAQGLTTALAVYQADVDRAQSTLTQVARDPQMSRALARRNGGPGRRAAPRSAAGRSRFQQVQSAPLPPVAVGVFDQLDGGAVASSRALIGAILAAFLLLALASSVLVVRALQGQIGDFLGAAQ